MKIVVIHGSPRKGNTFKATELFKKTMREASPVEFVDFFLPRDLPEFCLGCMTCFFKGEDRCPHSEYTLPIMNQMLKADALLFTTPVYVLSLSGGMKAFLDHFGHAFIVHRPRPEMFRKKAFILSTTAGAGTKSAIRTIRKSLRFWGVNRVYSYGFALFEVDWDKMNPKRKAKIVRKLQNKALRFSKEVASGRNRRPYRMISLMFWLRRLMIKKEALDSLDRSYWIEMGWHEGKKSPFRP
ncbi:MAG: flavodoxin family protein [Candidatus Izemoplasmataceae bacterium]